MTVHEIIEELSKYSPTTPVFINVHGGKSLITDIIYETDVHGTYLIFDDFPHK